MEAIVLAGGFGSRLRQVLPDIPKVMAPVAGRPFLEILLTSLSRKGFHRIVLSLGYMAEKVANHFGEQFAGMQIVYEVEYSPLGTGGAIRVALKRCLMDHVYVINGDTYMDIEAAEIEDHWQRHQHPIIVAREVADTSRYGRLYATNSSISGFSNQGHDGPGLINAGCYVFPIHILDESQCGNRFSLETDWLPNAVVQYGFDLFVSRGLFIDIGLPADYEKAQKVMLGIFD